VRPLADKKSLQLEAVLPEHLGTITSDPGRIQQILYNLLSNAIKFTPDSGRVELKVERADERHITMSVQDNGIGIPPEKLSLVFEKFKQLDDSMTREHSGTGLGLAISKELVTLLRGTITVESELEKGSTFRVTIPVDANLGTDTTDLHNVNLA
jgi:two-component system, NarL family, sensor histidine kinase BarA